MKIGFVTDEISPDLNIAITKCKEWGVSSVEIRNLITGRIPFISADERKLLISMIKDNKFEVSAISPGIFRFGYSEKERLKEDFDKTLPEAIKICKELDCNKMIIFGFRRTDLTDETDLDNVITEFGRVADIAAEFGIQVAIENGYDSWCKESHRILRIMESLNRPNLGINWDPGNAVGDKENLLETYSKIKKYITNLHVKDTKYNNGFSCHVLGFGSVDWDNQIRMILKDVPDINMTIETHCEPLIESSEKNLNILKTIIEKYKIN